ncbi:MAG: hypothetical protein H7269_11275 [Cellulomonas sp.]|nr:hypothetical protein [Cellulomonas sp.]
MTNGARERRFGAAGAIPGADPEVLSRPQADWTAAGARLREQLAHR